MNRSKLNANLDLNGSEKSNQEKKNFSPLPSPDLGSFVAPEITTSLPDVTTMDGILHTAFHHPHFFVSKLPQIRDFVQTHPPKQLIQALLHHLNELSKTLSWTSYHQDPHALLPSFIDQRYQFLEPSGSLVQFRLPLPSPLLSSSSSSSSQLPSTPQLSSSTFIQLDSVLPSHEQTGLLILCLVSPRSIDWTLALCEAARTSMIAFRWLILSPWVPLSAIRVFFIDLLITQSKYLALYLAHVLVFCPSVFQGTWRSCLLSTWTSSSSFSSSSCMSNTKTSPHEGSTAPTLLSNEPLGFPSKKSDAEEEDDPDAEEDDRLANRSDLNDPISSVQDPLALMVSLALIQQLHPRRTTSSRSTSRSFFHSMLIPHFVHRFLRHLKSWERLTNGVVVGNMAHASSSSSTSSSSSSSSLLLLLDANVWFPLDRIAAISNPENLAVIFLKCIQLYLSACSSIQEKKELVSLLLSKGVHQLPIGPLLDGLDLILQRCESNWNPTPSDLEELEKLVKLCAPTESHRVQCVLSHLSQTRPELAQSLFSALLQ